MVSPVSLANGAGERSRSVTSALMLSAVWPGVSRKEVLSEFLTAVCARGDHSRRLACRLVCEILNDRAIEVVAQSHESLLAGLALYERRPDK